MNDGFLGRNLQKFLTMWRFVKLSMKRSDRETECILTYKLLYGDEDIESILKKCLSQLNRDAALKECARINFSLFEIQNGKKQKEDLTREFFSSELDKMNDIKKKYGFASPVAFNRGQMVNMIWYILDHCPKTGGLRVDDAKFKSFFKKSALIVSNFIEERHHAGQWQNTGDLFRDSVQALPAIRKSREYSNHIAIESARYYQLLNRGCTIFLELFSDEYKRKYHDKFEMSLKDFYLINIGFILQFLVYEPNYLFNYTRFGENTRKPHKIREFVTMMSQTPSDLKAMIEEDIAAGSDPTNSMEEKLRKKPILRLEDGTAIITDITYFFENVILGPLFSLSEPGKQDAFNHFGECFHVYVENHLKRICNNENLHLKKIESKGSKKLGELEIGDAYLEVGDEIILIETKSVFVNNTKNFLNELEEKYCKRKGIKQIANSIEFLSSQRKDIKGFFPILIVNDRFIDDAEFLLRKKFEGMINNDLSIKIHPLIVVTIDILELLPKNDDLKSLFSKYFSYIEQNSSLITTLYNYCVYSKHELRISTDVLAKMQKLIAEARDYLFPKKAKSDE